MVKRTKPTEAEKISITFNEYFLKGGEEGVWKNKPNYEGKILDLITSRKYTTKELEVIYYLIELFLRNQAYPSYANIYSDMVKKSKEISPTNKNCFKFLTGGKTDLQKIIRKLGERNKKNKLAKGIIQSRKLKEVSKRRKKAERKRLGMKEFGSDKYFILNVSKLKKSFDLSLQEIFIALDILLLHNRSFGESLKYSNKFMKNLRSYMEDINNARL